GELFVGSTIFEWANGRITALLGGGCPNQRSLSDRRSRARRQLPGLKGLRARRRGRRCRRVRAAQRKTSPDGANGNGSKEMAAATRGEQSGHFASPGWAERFTRRGTWPGRYSGTLRDSRRGVCSCCVESVILKSCNKTV